MLGGFAFGAVYMATDPVTAAQTVKGKWIYGFLVGVMAITDPGTESSVSRRCHACHSADERIRPLIDHYVIEANIKKRLREKLK